ncbi:sorting nexin-20-like isoform X2 [Petromyzon marinus]|uniref:sorting nexin-20-like isoform X2 n=1 Tax=Petromyzon marinus TaxID=7757 RepID=UPI003F6EB5CF
MQTTDNLESARILERGCDHVTRAVQEAWRRARSETPASSPCASLLLGVVSAPHVTNPRGVSGGHTVYEIRVLVAGQLDSCPCTIVRRFCQFQLLHRALLSELGASALRGISLPRSLPAPLPLSLLPLPPPTPRCLQLYLRALCALPTVRASRRFQEFLWLEETARGHACLRGGAYAEAASLLRSASLLQERAAWVAADRAHSAPTLSALAVCARDMGHPRDALGYCERAIQALSGGVDGVRTVVAGRARPLRQRYPELWAPLLRARARLRWELGETDAMDEKEDKNVGVDGSGDPRSLKEVVIAQYLR